MAVLHQFKASQRAESPAKAEYLPEFKASLLAFPDQVYSRQPTNVNGVIQTHPLLEGHRRKLSGTDLFLGERLKVTLPHLFTQVIVACGVAEESQEKDHVHRYTIQPSWMTGKMVVVHEEAFIDEGNRQATFFGRPVDDSRARALLIPALIAEIEKGSRKAREAIQLPEGSQQDLREYLQENFDRLFLSEKPALFHVCHGVTGPEEEPIETWRLVRLEESKPEFAEIYAATRKSIGERVSAQLYLQTIMTLEEKEKHKTENGSLIKHRA